MEASTVPAGVPRGALRGASPALLRLASDNQLVRSVRAGRQAAFEVVYDRYHRPILSFCTQLLGDRHEAEDAVQHTFMAAYDSLLDHDRPIQLRPWLFAIARNRCYTVLRARREVASGEMAEGEGENPASIVQRRQDLRDLVSDVGRLPDDQRAALVMAELGALSHDEIALALEVPREKVKALVFQARQSLMATRSARETDCAQIREELSLVRGPALRRSHLRRHLHACEGCREYRSQLRHQHARLAALLPVVPSAALKASVLRATVGARTAGAGASGGAAAAGSTALKLALVKPAAMAILSVAGAAVVVHASLHHAHRPVLIASRTAVLFARSGHTAHAGLRADRVLGAEAVSVSRGAHGTASVHRRFSRLNPGRPRALPARQSPPLAAAPAGARLPAPTRPVPTAKPAPAQLVPTARPEPVASSTTPATARRESRDRPTVTHVTETQTSSGDSTSTRSASSGDRKTSTLTTASTDTTARTCTPTGDRTRKHHRHRAVTSCAPASPKTAAQANSTSAPTAATPQPTTSAAPSTSTAPAADTLTATSPSTTEAGTQTQPSSERYRVSTTRTRRTAAWPKHQGP